MPRDEFDGENLNIGFGEGGNLTGISIDPLGGNRLHRTLIQSGLALDRAQQLRLSAIPTH